MTDFEPTPEAPAAEESERIEVLYEGQCPSLTGRSVLSFQLGRDPQSNEPHLRILRNSGKGMWAKSWAAVGHIDAILAKADQVSARTFHDVHPGKSINTGGFILAILKDLGVVRPKEGSRCHERVPGASLQQAITFKIKEVAALGKTRKPKGG